MNGQRDRATVFQTSHAADGVIGLHRHAAPYTAVAAGRLSRAEIERRAGNVMGEEAVARWRNAP